MMKTMVIVFCFLFLSPLTALATSGHEFNSYFTFVHFKDNYYGKKVKAVYAHVGVQMQKRFHILPGQNEKYWVQVNHLKMEKVNDHFFQKVELNSEFHSHYGDLLLGPVVQYWIYLEDGSEIMSDTYSIKLLPSQESVRGNREDLLKSDIYLNTKDIFNKSTDREKTEAIRVYASYVS